MPRAIGPGLSAPGRLEEAAFAAALT